MKRIALISAAVAALISVSGCSSNGRFGFNGGLGASGGGSGGSNAPSGAGSGSGGASSTLSTLSDSADGVVATAGNLVSGGGQGDFGQATDPLGRITVANERVIDGDSNGAIGLSAASDHQEQGQFATLGVLHNGQVIASNEIEPASSSGDLIGVSADDDQVIGQGQHQQVDLDLLASGDSQGDLASADLLTAGQIVDIEVNGAQQGLDGLTGDLGNLIDGND
jgi:hypothetical protein